jgi:hypothetical protein
MRYARSAYRRSVLIWICERLGGSWFSPPKRRNSESAFDYLAVNFYA